LRPRAGALVEGGSVDPRGWNDSERARSAGPGGGRRRERLALALRRRRGADGESGRARSDRRGAGSGGAGPARHGRDHHPSPGRPLMRSAVRNRTAGASRLARAASVLTGTAFVLALTAGAAHAQVDWRAGAGATFESYFFGSPGEVDLDRVTLMTVPLGVDVRLMRNLDIRVSSAFAHGT